MPEVLCAIPDVLNGSVHNKHRLRQMSVMYSDASSFLQSEDDSSSQGYHSKSNEFSDPLSKSKFYKNNGLRSPMRSRNISARSSRRY